MISPISSAGIWGENANATEPDDVPLPTGAAGLDASPLGRAGGSSETVGSGKCPVSAHGAGGHQLAGFPGTAFRAIRRVFVAGKHQSFKPVLAFFTFKFIYRHGSSFGFAYKWEILFDKIMQSETMARKICPS
jgi:hypothetical protein